MGPTRPHLVESRLMWWRGLADSECYLRRDDAGAGGERGDAAVVILQSVPTVTRGETGDAAVEVRCGDAALLAGGGAVQAGHPVMAGRSGESGSLGSAGPAG